MTFEVYDNGPLSAQESMELDAEWILQLSTFERPRVRFYEWKQKAITYGYFLEPEKLIDCKKAQACGYELARRPTGGGLLFHQQDFAFTVAIPSHHILFSQVVLENYQVINGALLQAIAKVYPAIGLYNELASMGTFPHLCMATPTKYDLIVGGRKIGGSAQRKTAGGFLHQGSVFLSVPNWKEIASFLHLSEEALAAMQSCMSSLEGPQLRMSIKSSLAEQLNSSLRK